MALEDLPDACLAHIGCLLTVEDRLRCSAVSKRLYASLGRTAWSLQKTVSSICAAVRVVVEYGSFEGFMVSLDLAAAEALLTHAPGIVELLTQALPAAAVRAFQETRSLNCLYARPLWIGRRGQVHMMLNFGCYDWRSSWNNYGGREHTAIHAGLGERFRKELPQHLACDALVGAIEDALTPLITGTLSLGYVDPPALYLKPFRFTYLAFGSGDCDRTLCRDCYRDFMSHATLCVAGSSYKVCPRPPSLHA